MRVIFFSSWVAFSVLSVVDVSAVFLFLWAGGFLWFATLMESLTNCLAVVLFFGRLRFLFIKERMSVKPLDVRCATDHAFTLTIIDDNTIIWNAVGYGDERGIERH